MTDALSSMPLWVPVLLFVAGLWAGVQNALAGGGSFITLPALMLSGMSPLAANMTSTVALFPAQVATGWTGRALVTNAGALSFRAMFIISMIGGVLGGLLLMNTPSSIFARLVPWLVLLATGLFAWGSFFRKPPQPGQQRHLSAPVAGCVQLCIAVYGGYFGGGIGFLMMAVMAMAGVPTRNAAATKNVLAGVMNAAAVALFVFSRDMHWLQGVLLSMGAILGGWLGALALHRVNERLLRLVVIAIGIVLTVGLFVRPV